MQKPTSNTTGIEANVGVEVCDDSSGWRCDLFGSVYPYGISYSPVRGQVPNAFVRWMMRLCLGCTWVREQRDPQPREPTNLERIGELTAELYGKEA